MTNVLTLPISFRCLSLAAAMLAASALPGAAQVQISGLSPNPVLGGSAPPGDPLDPANVIACNGAPQDGTVYRNSEVEPHIAVNPTNPDNMIAGWHQDRWSTGGGQSLGAAYTTDGGATWTEVIIPFTRCSGGGSTRATDWERASDPWISFSPDGTAHYMSLSFKDTVSQNAMAVSSSSDGGASWSSPVIITGSPAQDANGRSLFHDKNTLTADRDDPDIVYATWTLFRWGNTTLLFAKSEDGGQTWRHARPISGFATVGPAEQVFFRQGAQIVQAPDGTLYNFYYRILFDLVTFQVTFDQATFRSEDQGDHWEKMEAQVSTFSSAMAFDPELGVPVRDAGEIPDVAVGPNGELYVVWQDANGSPLFPTVKISMSTDGGFTWSAPQRANPLGPDDVQAFLPAVAVNDAGQVGVLFYDLRNDVIPPRPDPFAPPDPLSTDVFMTVFAPDLTDPVEYRLTAESMDLRQSVITGGRGYFPGDYVGLDTAGSDFVAAFTRNNDLGLAVDWPQPSGLRADTHDRTNIVFARVTPPQS